MPSPPNAMAYQQTTRNDLIFLRSLTRDIDDYTAIVQKHASYIDCAKIRHSERENYQMLPPDGNTKYFLATCVILLHSINFYMNELCYLLGAMLMIVQQINI